MRTNQEIDRAVTILRKKGDRLSLAQAGIIEDKRSEAWVFANYVANVPQQSKDEEAYYAARDAARYVAGSITLEELIPDADKYPVAESVKVAKPKVDTQALLCRVDKLERMLEELLDERRARALYQKKPDYNRSDFINQQKACEYIGCSKNTLKSWTDKGLVVGYRKGTQVCYSKSELSESSTVQNFIHLKKQQP